MNWLKRIFVPQDDLEDSSPSGLDDDHNFLTGQHVRIVLAILVTLVSAVVIWQILV